MDSNLHAVLGGGQATLVVTRSRHITTISSADNDVMTWSILSVLVTCWLNSNQWKNLQILCMQGKETVNTLLVMQSTAYQSLPGYS